MLSEVQKNNGAVGHASASPTNFLPPANLRLIARMDIKGPNLIKGVHLECLRVMGDPQKFAKQYYEQGADEILYMDIVASLYGRNNLAEIVRRTAQNVFVPLTVGGGVRSVDDVKSLLRSGADKVAINTAATKDPTLITAVSRRFGSQCMVVSIEAKKQASGQWEVFVDNGREHTNMDVVQWAIRCAELGAGEILLTSIDREGTGKGFDCELVRAVSQSVPIPVIASGGMGSIEHLEHVVRDGLADALAMADVLHYGKMTIPQIRTAASAAGFEVRNV